MDIQTWIQRLPKSEHHLHIEGTIPWKMVLETSSEVLPPQPEWAAKGFRFKDFSDFIYAMGAGIHRVLNDAEGYHRIASHHFQLLAQQNVRYVETSFAVSIAINRGFAYADVIRAIRSAAPENMIVQVYAAFNRESVYSDEVVQDVLNTHDLAGVDLHGDERISDSVDRFVPIYDEARRLGLRTKAHAGELRDSSSVMEVMEKLRPQRIEHGITAAKDAAVLKLLVDNQIILDMCPTSNVMLRVVPDIETYPIRAFLEQGIQLTINTDDPGVFGCTLGGELLALVEHDLLTVQEIAALQSNAFARADMDDTLRNSIAAETVALMAELKG